MSSPLRVLIVDDSPDDAELLTLELRRSGFAATTERVDTAEDLTEALRRGPWDLVISDWSMPRFTAHAALNLVKTAGLDVPFIIASGTIGEETAVEAMQAGADDFVVKSRLIRLGPVVTRELRDAEVRRERRKLEDRMMLTERMASVGLLAAGIVHEINNPLTCVLANLSVLQQQFTPGQDEEDMSGALSDALEAARRIKELVHDVRIFSRGEEDHRAPVDVHRVLDSSLRMAATEIRRRASLVKDYGSVPRVEANESRLGQVFLNLLVNAAQSIQGDPNCNEIRIRTHTDAFGQATLEISDTGAGIPDDVRKDLFTPFVTTKPVGVGMGLGLSICHRIITSLGGTISVDSEPGRGSLFRVSIPPYADPSISSALRAKVIPVS